MHLASSIVNLYVVSLSLLSTGMSKSKYFSLTVDKDLEVTIDGVRKLYPIPVDIVNYEVNPGKAKTDFSKSEQHS